MGHHGHHSHVSTFVPSSSELANENRVRQLALRRGYRISKSRRQPSLDNFGAFMLVEHPRNIVVLGSRFDASLQEIATYLRKEL